MSEDFKNLVAVVTGGAAGIGLATAHELQSRGAAVAVLDQTEPPAGTTFSTHAADVTDGTVVVKAIESIAREYGGIDIVVNNAGIGAVGAVEDNDMSEWMRVIDVNVMGIARVTSAALPYLRASEAAAVVNMCSIAALVGLPQRALYSASKGAVLALTRAMAADHVADGVRVNCVSPGTANTPWVQRLLARSADPRKELASLSARQPTGRLVEPVEVARAIAYLASPLGSGVTGVSLSVDGGMDALRLPS